MFYVGQVFLLWFDLGTIHLRCQQIFTIVYPYSPPLAFFTTIHLQIWPLFDPSPPKQQQNADALNEWFPWTIFTRNYQSCRVHVWHELFLLICMWISNPEKSLAPLTPDRPQVKRPPPSLQITSNFLVFYGLSHGTTLKKKGVAVF